ncbi:S-layer homology domain-containing protein [Pseudoflavonifractor phocaeensis]|uniref:S-layer homology domain-containing protein n=1 Tax=Pseudoflavonifractor phocaeensis TaxID=1870988 RepID=UPI00210EE7A0|nr:S-layer homology domain-containing protein [Pseudoflavonifractor phocaeensis]MCQ4866364.1 S-layer homology domain-containing protein [Pseudoflavonifractor phocaeensis]
MTGKSGKRFLAAVLTVCLVLSLTVGASAASRFTDVKTSHWAYDEIIDVVDKEIFLGTSATTFAPEMEMTRAMFVTVLARLAGAEVDDSESSDFRDVPTGQWYTGAVAWAAEKGIVKGVSDTMFAPTQVITREQMATMILRYTDYLKIKLPTTEREIRFDDDNEISDFAADAVLACQRAGLLQGVGSNRFNPQGTATRSQVAVLVSRLAELDGTIAYTVSFEPNNGKTVESQTVMSGKTAKQPTGVTRSGYSLSGWYTDAKLTQRFSFSTKITGNLTLYAKWSRYSGGGYYVTYTDPAAATEAEVGGEVATTGSPFYGMPLTYPAVSVSGSEIKLSGVYTAADVSKWFGSSYSGKEGYVVPLKLTAPSDYSGGDVKLTITGETNLPDVNKTIKQDELDGEYYFYLFKFVPKDTTGWDPTVTVSWNGSSVSYTMDVSGMTAHVDKDTSKVQGLTGNDTIDTAGFDGIQLTYPNVLVAATDSANRKYAIHLSGGYVAGGSFPGFPDTSEYQNGYVIPLRFTAPNNYATEQARLEISGGIGSKDVKVDLTNGSFDLLMYIPANPGANWNPTIKVTWTRTVRAWGLYEDTNTVTYTYTLNTANMKPAATSRLPAAGTEAQIAAATNQDGNPFKGVAPYCADVTLTESSSGSKTFLAGGTYAPLPTGQSIPGFGVVGAEGAIKADSLILPILFYRPTGINVDGMKGSDTLLNIKLYRDGSSEPASSTDYTKDSIQGENPFLFLLQVDSASLTNDNYSRRFVLTWYGGYAETYTVKLGDLKRIGGATATGVPGADTLKKATDGTAFKGIGAFVADVKAARQGQTNTYALTGSYTPVPAGTTVPGFGESGRESAELNGDWCILPIHFNFTPPAANTLSDDYNLVTIKITGGTKEKTVTLTRSQVMADPSFTYLFLLKDPQKAGDHDKKLTFELTWADKQTETFVYDIANLSRATVNADGAKFNTTAQEKADIAKSDGPFKDIVINGIDIIAQTKDGETTLKLSRLDAAQTAEAIRKYYGDTYGPGYIVALKFTAPATDGVKYTALTQTVTKGYTGKDTPQVKEITLDRENGEHILLMYIPAAKPYEDYAPVIKLEWKGTREAKQSRWNLFREAAPDDVSTTQTFMLDLAGMGIAPYTAPKA